jgi:HAD superfamily hydrolase (TIGR01662 family)
VIQGVVFDLGSTLIQFTGDWPQVFANSLDILVDQLHKERLSFDSARFRKDFEKALSDYYKQRDKDLIERSMEVVLVETLKGLRGTSPPIQAVKRALEGMYRVSQQHWQIIPSTHEVLESLKKRGLRMGIISNASDVADVERLIDKAGIRDYMDPILISAGFGLRKPHPDIFNAVLHQWEFPAEHVVMVGDLLKTDILGADRVGMKHIWMTEVIDQSELEEPYPVEPDAIAERLADVPGIIETLEKKRSPS